MEVNALPDGVVAVGVHGALGNGNVLVGVVYHDVRVLAHLQRSLGGAAEDSGGVGAAQLHRLLEGDPSGIGLTEHVGIEILNTGTAVGDFGEIILAPVLFIGLEGAVVGGHGVDKPGFDGCPERVLTLLTLHGGRADKVAPVGPLVDLAGEV
ncbi:hypothetical protein SDC9_162671 [bioreactor metagenome]|uniref:Uncharacterized protein n=1 Tax=bioreactor metagenome TaxID=1076179 RepID=A0A645FN15_9ZZZZ